MRLQQWMILSGETVSPTRLLFQYMQSFPKRDKIKAFIAPMITYLITFLDNNGKLSVYTGVNIHGIYLYLEIIWSPTKLTTSGQRSHHFGPSYSTNIDTATLQSVISDFCVLQKIICECCGRIGHKADTCIIRGPEFLPPSLIIKMNKSNTLRDDEPTEVPREWNNQPWESHFKYRTSPPQISLVISYIMGRLNH